MSPLQESVVKAVLVAASVGAGGTLLTNTITNATQDEQIADVREELSSLDKMRDTLNRIDKNVAVLEERTRDERH